MVTRPNKASDLIDELGQQVIDSTIGLTVEPVGSSKIIFLKKYFKILSHILSS